MTNEEHKVQAFFALILGLLVGLTKKEFNKHLQISNLQVLKNQLEEAVSIFQDKTKYQVFKTWYKNKFGKGLNKSKFQNTLSTRLRRVYGILEIERVTPSIPKKGAIAPLSEKFEIIAGTLPVIVFARRSTEKQSRYSVETIVDEIRNIYGDVYILFADDSSSFKDNAFIHALMYAKKHGYAVRVHSSTRTALETVTRSSEIMAQFVSFVQENLMMDIEVQGQNLYFNGELLVFLAAQNEPQWLFKANTRHYPKHTTYTRILLGKASMNELDSVQKRELTALIKYNQGIERTLKFFQNLAIREIAILEELRKRKEENKKNK